METKMIRHSRTFLITSLITLGMAIPCLVGYAEASGSANSATAPRSFAPIVEPLLPAVVNISTTTEASPDRRRGEMPGIPGGTPLEEFFKQFMDEYQNRIPRKTSSLGSGFLIEQNGSTAYVVTCYHVIADADEIKVILSNGKEFKAQVVGKNRRTDLAVLKFTSQEKLTTVGWGDSSTSRVGDWVIAVGNPFGLSSTVTTGIISTIARDIGARSRGLASSIVEGYIQTDASINMGNSGGPMFNMDGKVIGINTAIFSPNGGSIGIGFAIPSALAQTVVKDLITHGYAMSGWLGVNIQVISEEMAESIGLKNTHGALVGEVIPKGPAEKAGLMTGDVILKFNGTDIKESKILPMAVAKSPIGQSLPIIILRDGKEMTLQITVGNFDKAEKDGLINVDEDAAPKLLRKHKQVLGLGLQGLTSGMKERFNIPDATEGLLVISIDPQSEAAEKGIRNGDVIQEITVAGKKQKLKTPEAYEKTIMEAKASGQRQILLLLLRGNSPRFVTLSLKTPEETPNEKDGQ